MKRSWLRTLLVISPLPLSVVLTSTVSPSQLMLVLNLLLGAGIVVCFLHWPALGLIVGSVAGMIVPFYGPSGLNATMILIALLLGLWLLDMVARLRQIRMVSSGAMRALLAFTVVALLSFGVGQLPWFTFASRAPLGAQLGGLSITLLSAGTFLLMANQVHDLVWLSRMTWVFLASSAVYIAVRSVLPALGLPTHALLQPLGSALYIWLVAIAFSQAVFNRMLHPVLRLGLVGLVLVCLYVLFFMKFADKSGWIPALVCIVTIIGFRSWRVGLVLGALSCLLAFYLISEVIGSDWYSVLTRFDAWSIMAEIIRVNPMFGLGFANYYWYTPLFPIRGYEISFNSHNNYVDIVAQTGLVGLLCFTWFLWEVTRLGLQLRERVPVGFAQAYVYGALGGLAGTAAVGMFGDWVLPFFYNIGLNGFRTSMLSWLFLGGLVSLEHMKRLAKS